MMNMDVQIRFLLAAFTQWKLTFSMTASLSGRISENVSFFHEAFPVPPSMRAIIEVGVLVPSNLVRKSRRYPMLGIFTTQNHVNIRKQCTRTPYGQVLNRYLHPGLTLDQNRSKPLTCELFYDNLQVICRGFITVQDYLPRKFSFSLGFHCGRISLLRGLVYAIKIHVSNATTCLVMDSPWCNI